MIEVNARNIRTWSMLGQRGTAFAIALPDIAAEDKKVMILTADLSLLSGLEKFKQTYPEQFLDVGIAEQNMIGIAAGLAKEGNCVFTTTYATFITMRSYEQIRNNLGVMGFNVKVIGSAGGVSMGTSGNCHHSIEDIALMRVIPNMQIISPADGLETVKVMQAISKTDKPTYVRLTGVLNCPVVYKEDYEFELGKGNVLNQGKDVAIVATGTLVAEALKAAEMLKEEGINPTVVDMHTIKPLDTALIEELAKTHGTICTLEEHSIIGGLGGAVAECLAEIGTTAKLVRMGFKDEYSELGAYEYILQQSKLDAQGVKETILQL